MSFFQKIMSFFGAAGAQVVSQAGEPLTAVEQENLANSIEFHSLLQDEQQAIIAKQAQDISAQNKAIASQAIAIKTLSDAVEAQSAKNADWERMIVEAMQAFNQNVTAKVEAVAQGVNKLKGAPILQTTAEQDPNNEMLGVAPKSEVVTIEGYLARLKGGR